jgi:hypothetical protein
MKINKQILLRPRSHFQPLDSYGFLILKDSSRLKLHCEYHLRQFQERKRQHKTDTVRKL